MYDVGEAEKGVIRPEFKRSVQIDFKGVKITSDTGVLMLKELDELFDNGEEVRRSIEWLIRRMIKVAAKVAYHSKRWHIHVASAFPLAHYYRPVLGYG